MLRNCSTAIVFFYKFFPWLYSKGIRSFTLQEISNIFGNQDRVMKGYLTYYMRNSASYPIKINAAYDTERNISVYILTQS